MMQPSDPLQDIHATVQSLEQLIYQRLSKKIDMAAICYVAELCISTLEMLTQKYNHLEPTETLACGKGCSTCCTTMRVVVRPIFAIYALIAFRQSHSDLDYNQMTERLLSKPVNCALLVDNACSIYEKRPMACRSFYSFDYDLCLAGIYNEENRETPPENHKYRLNRVTASLIDQAMLNVEKHLGLETEKVFLHNALAILLHRPDAIEKWAKGENVFSKSTPKQ